MSRKAQRRPRSSRRFTVRDPSHPHNRMKEAGAKARKDLASRSNDELCAWIEENVTDDDVRLQILALPRGKQIKWIAGATERQFADEWNAAQAAAKKKAEAQAHAEAEIEAELSARVRYADDRRKRQHLIFSIIAVALALAAVALAAINQFTR